MSDSLQPHGLQHARLPCPSLFPEACSNPCPLSLWCHLTISSSVVPFCCLQPFPASGSFPMGEFFASGGQSIRVSASTSVLPIKTQVWSPLRLANLIFLQSKRLSRVFSNTTVQKHQFFSTQPSLWKKHCLVQSDILRRKRGKEYFHITFITGYCSNCLLYYYLLLLISYFTQFMN